MTTELLYLALVTVFTAVLWVPYILNRFVVWGLSDTVGYPTSPRPQAPWAIRLLKAHANAVENLVVFAALALIAQSAGVSNSVTAAACIVYFWALVGFFAQVAVAWQLFASTSFAA